MSAPGSAAGGASARASGAVAAVDLGATSGRVMIGRVGPGVLALESVARFPNGPVERAGGWRWDFGALFGSVVTGLADAVRTEPGVASIGIDSWAVDYGLVRGEELLAEPFHYRDGRTAAGVAVVHARVPFADLYRRNGLQHLPFNTLYQYAVEERLSEAEASLLIPDLVAYLLTGKRVAERTNASTTGLLDVRTGAWDRDLAERIGIPPALDLGRFLDLIAEEGMHAIVRPGPYVCAEWNNGGLPTWLTADERMRLRSSDPDYLEAVTAYLDRVYEIVAPRQIDRDGSVILVQIENEYGAYGSDAAYLEALVRRTREAGITVPLTQVDQPIPAMLSAGGHPELHTTGSFGSRIPERLAALRAHQTTGPLMCMEFWCGWFDHWGEHHHTTPVADAAADLDALLSSGASVNIYMVHGGTNFGLSAGANDEGRYLPLVTSYDYDAPISESGAPTEKYWAFREVIARHAPVPDEVPARPAPAPAFEVPLRPAGDPLPAASVARGRFEQPPSFDELGVEVVLAAYAADLPPAFGGGVLTVDAALDLAWVRVDGRPVGTLSRTLGEFSLALPPGARLELLVEDTGRVNYGPHIGERKGLIGAPRVDGTTLSGWDVSVIDVHRLVAADAAAGVRDAASAARATEVRDAASASDAAPHPCAGPVGLRGRFTLDAPADLHLDTRGWGKGYAWVNGFFLGRYWRRGPQRTLFVPGPVTRAGANDVVIVELENATPVARFLPQPDLGHEVE